MSMHAHKPRPPTLPSGAASLRVALKFRRKAATQQYASTSSGTSRTLVVCGQAVEENDNACELDTQDDKGDGSGEGGNHSKSSRRSSREHTTCCEVLRVERGSARARSDNDNDNDDDDDDDDGDDGAQSASTGTGTHESRPSDAEVHIRRLNQKLVRSVHQHIQREVATCCNGPGESASPGASMAQRSVDAGGGGANCDGAALLRESEREQPHQHRLVAAVLLMWRHEVEARGAGRCPGALIFDIPASCSITASVCGRVHTHAHAHTLHAGVNTNSRAHDFIQTTTHTTETTRTHAQSRKLLQRSALWRVQLATWWRATVDLVCCFPSSTPFFLARQRCRRCHSDCRTTHAAVPKERRKRVWRAKEVVVEAKQQAFHHAGCTDTSALPRLLFEHSTRL
jgi:hypothetical protein